MTKALKEIMGKMVVRLDGKYERSVRSRVLSAANSATALETNLDSTAEIRRLFKRVTLRVQMESSELIPKRLTRMELRSVKFFQLEPF